VNDAAAVESVRAYLRTFKLNERELLPGMTIPFTVFVFALDKSFSGRAEAARATGKMGPGGHQVYELTTGQYLEIAPE
jgi:hypothetical protein